MNTFIIFTKCIQNALFFSSSFFVQTILDCVYKSSLKCWYEWQWRPNTSTSRPVKSWLSEFVDHFALLWTLCFWRFDLTTCGSFFFYLPLWIDGHLPGASVQTSLLNSAASTFIYSLSLSLSLRFTSSPPLLSLLISPHTWLADWLEACPHELFYRARGMSRRRWTKSKSSIRSVRYLCANPDTC